MAAEKAHDATQTIVNDIKAGLHGIHGAGEAIRGGAMEALDGIFHKKEGEARDREIYERGLAEMKGTEDRFEANQVRPHKNEHLGFGNHRDQESHGQGSHFAQAHAIENTGAPHHDPTTTGADEIESREAARAAWQEKH
ncbi:hypothetical protein PV04_05649 [Phialophora macrospora]|uniref:Uncharacterized protein n=1 Tax=Phialophora macrospora TaxID=1851006 RepID=A0A0D2DW15_9EURO|nr:hypothetical protein PV04_05649 [Phialophora macrospora]